jgi:hypothetical protein
MIRIAISQAAFDAIAASPQPAGTGAMLVACRLAGLSALEAHYGGVAALMQSRPHCRRRQAKGERSIWLEAKGIVETHSLAAPKRTGYAS